MNQTERRNLEARRRLLDEEIAAINEKLREPDTKTGWWTARVTSEDIILISFIGKEITGGDGAALTGGYFASGKPYFVLWHDKGIEGEVIKRLDR